VLGEALDTNGRWLAARLHALGIRTVEHVTLGDDARHTAATLRRLAGAFPLVITSGGLGPTPDDVTRAALAELAGQPLEADPDQLARIAARLHSQGRTLTDPQRLQALRPRGATCLDNDLGTAPGLHLRVPAAHAGGPPGPWSDVFCLPGPPRELEPMFEDRVVPRLRPDPAGVPAVRLLHTVGLAESEAAARLGDLLERGREPEVGITASGMVLTIRVRGASRPGGPGAVQAADHAIERARAALAPYVLGTGPETLESMLLDELVRGRARVAVVESCTGGLLGSLLCRVPGSSAVFAGGWITYADAHKLALGVPAGLLARHGAVSPETARALALAGLEAAARAQEAPGVGPLHCLAITGVAGPGGGTPGKPVGTVRIAHAWAAAATAAPSSHVTARHFHFPGTRADVQERAARSALAMLLFHLRGHGPGLPPLLWERPAPPASLTP